MNFVGLAFVIATAQLVVNGENGGLEHGGSAKQEAQNVTGKITASNNYNNYNNNDDISNNYNYNNNDNNNDDISNNYNHINYNSNDNSNNNSNTNDNDSNNNDNDDNNDNDNSSNNINNINNNSSKGNLAEYHRVQPSFFQSGHFRFPGPLATSTGCQIVCNRLPLGHSFGFGGKAGHVWPRKHHFDFPIRKPSRPLPRKHSPGHRTDGPTYQYTYDLDSSSQDDSTKRHNHAQACKWIDPVTNVVTNVVTTLRAPCRCKSGPFLRNKRLEYFCSATTLPYDRGDQVCRTSSSGGYQLFRTSCHNRNQHCAPQPTFWIANSVRLYFCSDALTHGLGSVL